jgi:competence protein ComEC
MNKIKWTLSLVAALLSSSVCAQAQMKAHYINVGQAEAILLELPKAAVLIDAGGECTCDDRDKDRLMNHLKQFFNERSDLNKTIHTIIISHPHIDHTMLLMDVMQRFTVLNLVDGGDDSGSGIVPLFAARWFASQRKINYFAVKDKDVGKDGLVIPPLQELNDMDSRADIRLLSGSRGCVKQNNDSLVVLASYQKAKFIFTGDAEALEEPDETCTPELTNLLDRYKGGTMLDVDVFKVGHHGALNGVSDAWLKALSPKLSVISAGLYSQDSPGAFHASQFGHPREDVVQLVERRTSESRKPTTVVTMDAVRKPRKNRPLKKAVYCTCWDNDVIIQAGEDGKVSVLQPAP